MITTYTSVYVARIADDLVSQNVSYMCLNIESVDEYKIIIGSVPLKASSESCVIAVYGTNNCSVIAIYEGESR